MSKHTPEPWMISSGLLICDKDAKVIANSCAFMGIESIELPLKECEANAYRIVACVNACKGISTEDLEQGVLLQGLINSLKESRKELLEALKKQCNNALELGYCSKPTCKNCESQQAIAKAEGKEVQLSARAKPESMGLGG